MKNKKHIHIFERIRSNDIKAFEELFHIFYGPLCSYALRFLSQSEEAEEVVQDIFVKLWEKRNEIHIDASVQNYLFRSVRNQCLNLIQHQKIKSQYAEKMMKQSKTETGFSAWFVEPDLARNIETAIDSMPEKRKEIFRLSREDGLKYKEIAEKLNISVKTVEAQMGLALKYLRKKLQAYNPDSTLFQIFL